MKFSRAVRALALASTAALTLTATTVAQAHADEGEGGKPQRISTARGMAHFYNIGETIEARDFAKDGYGIRAHLFWAGGNHASVWAGGKGEVKTKDISVPEGTTVYLQLCYTDGGKDFQCSKTQKGRA